MKTICLLQSCFIAKNGNYFIIDEFCYIKTIIFLYITVKLL